MAQYLEQQTSPGNYSDGQELGQPAWEIFMEAVRKERTAFVQCLPRVYRRADSYTRKRSNLQGSCLRLLEVYLEARVLIQLRHASDAGLKERVCHREATRASSRLVRSPVQNVLLQATQLSWDVLRRP